MNEPAPGCTRSSTATRAPTWSPGGASAGIVRVKGTVTDAWAGTVTTSCSGFPQVPTSRWVSSSPRTARPPSRGVLYASATWRRRVSGPSVLLVTTARSAKVAPGLAESWKAVRGVMTESAGSTDHSPLSAARAWTGKKAVRTTRRRVATEALRMARPLSWNPGAGRGTSGTRWCDQRRVRVSVPV